MKHKPLKIQSRKQLKPYKKLRQIIPLHLRERRLRILLEELWSIFHVVFPGLFGTLRDFSHLRKQAISRRIRPFLLRRRKADVLSELPEKLEEIQFSGIIARPEETLRRLSGKIKT